MSTTVEWLRCAPNGVNATRWLRKTTPDPSKLTPLAAWLVEHVPGCVAGNMPAFRLEDRVSVYNGKTQADMVRAEAENGWTNGRTMFYQNVERAREVAENIIRCYDLENKPCKIDDWWFDKIRFEESDEEYWDRTAAAIATCGAGGYVEIGGNTFNLPPRVPRPISEIEELAHIINARLAEIGAWVNKKMIQWRDRPENQKLCRLQASSWRFRTINNINYVREV